tara:strand:- start:541 stop:1164 length:624 start_codon:yes stop_codon:yes gene_type:complete
MEKEENQNSQSDNNDEIKENKDTDKTYKNKDLESEDKIKDLEDKLARAYAEIENQRRRFEKEKDEAFDYGGFSLARETLNLVDNLERSKFALENDEKLKNSETLKKTVEHLNVIQNDMISILKKNNIEQIKSIDQKLDPNLHQAMMEIEDDNKEPGTVVQEIQKGFMMKDRLLRPSLVAVSKKINKKDENLKKNQKSEENQSKSNEN